MTGALSPMGLAALTLATEYGLAVLPLHQPTGDGGCSCWKNSECEHPGKHPRTPHGLKDASTHPEAIAEWWDRFPDANIGAVPGSIECAVIDIDGPAGEALARSLSVLDTPTCSTMTPRGAHHWFRLSPGTFVGNASRDELDVRSSAGYVVMPPSVHPSGTAYSWRGSLDDVADVPPELLAWLTPHAPPALTPATGAHPERSERAAAVFPLNRSQHTLDGRASARVMAYATRVGYGLSDGRKCAAYRFAAFMLHDVGLGLGEALRFLETWNSFNAPPLPARVLSDIHTNAHRFGGKAGAA